MKKNRFFSVTMVCLIMVCFSVQYSCNSGRSATFQKIKRAVDAIWIVDTHEHFGKETSRIESVVDFFSLVIGYLQADMLSSGMSNDELTFMLDNKKPLEERWKVFYPHWEKAKNTGYGLCLQATVKGLFDIDDINKNTFPEINRKMVESNKKVGWYQHVLKDKSHIDVSIVDPLANYPPTLANYPADFFVRVKRFDDFIVVNSNNFTALEKQYDVKISSLSDYLNVLDKAFDKAVEEGNVGVKSGLAYGRKLHYEDVPRDEAELLFSRVDKFPQVLNKDDFRKLEDFMFHQVIARAEKYGLPIQIHTGSLSRNFRSNPIENTNAAHLSNLFVKYKKAKFVIFHGSYPYMAELSYLAKHYPNVYIDMCWMHIISPSSSTRYLEEWLFTVPSNKIMAFGGDASVEWAFGHSVLARKIVTETLVKMVNDGYYTEDEAIVIAERILRKNAIDLFKLEKKNNNWGKSI